MEKHVTSLELSRRLYDLGVPQKSKFYWVSKDGIDWSVEYGSGYEWSDYPAYGGYPFKVSAFLSSELGEIIRKVDDEQFPEAFDKFMDEGGYDKNYIEIRDAVFLPDFWAKTIIYLIENSIIDVKSLCR